MPKTKAVKGVRGFPRKNKTKDPGSIPMEADAAGTSTFNQCAKNKKYKLVWCDICQENISSSSICSTALKIHKKRFHTIFQFYHCDICNKAIRNKGLLDKHRKTHFGYTCGICGKNFKLKGDLNSHRKKHKGVCNICEKRYSRKDFLLDHLRSHAEERPYSCEICQKSFKQSYELVNHNKCKGHLIRMENYNKESNQSHFVDCGEDIKVEVKEEESVDDPLSFHEETTKESNDNIAEVK